MTIKHDVRTRMFLAGTWTDVTSSVLVRDGIEIERGRGDESEKTPPQTCHLTLDNRSGNFSVRNPLGPYYGTLGRNNPVEVSVVRATDTFSRTVSNGWGTNDSGLFYVQLGTGVVASDWNVSGGEGSQRQAAAGGYLISVMAGVVARDVDFAGTVRLGFTNVTGGNVEPAGLILRYQDALNYYAARVEITAAEAINIGIIHPTFGTLAFPVATGFTHSAGQSLRVRFQAEGHTLRAKVWPASGSEPLGWQVEVHDTLITTAGFVGVRDGLAAGNTNFPVTFFHDNWVISSPRYAGEISNLPAAADTSNKDRYVKIKSAGVLRRLGQGTNPVQSAPRRYLPTAPGIVYYWPLEDGPLAERGRPVVGNVDLQSFAFAPFGPVTQFGEGKLAPWLGAAPELQNEVLGTEEGQLAMPTFTPLRGWMLDYYVNAKGVDDPSDGFYVFCPDGKIWTVSFDHALGEITITSPFGGALTSSEPQYFDGRLHHVSFEVRQNGANVAQFLSIDDDLAMAYGAVGSVYREPGQVVFTNGDKPKSIGHVALYEGTANVHPRPTLQIACWQGERALSRLIRLCSENDVHLDYIGNITDTPPMGPQGVKTLLELINECVDADGGSLYETKGTVGLAYRTRTSMYADTVVMDVNVAGYQVVAPFAPVEDDRLSRNKVTVKQTYGSEYTSEITSGPMSTQDFPNGIGAYDSSITLSLNDFTDARGMADWLVSLGTVDEPRWPNVQFELNAPAALALQSTMYDVDIDDRFRLSNLASVGMYNSVEQIQRGYTESWTNHRWSRSLNASPASPYDVTVLDTAPTVLDSGSSVLTSTITSSATTVGVSSASGDLWTTSGADFPIPVMVAGEEWSVTNITGSASPQTFTMARAVNGIQKAQTVGTAIHPKYPSRTGL